MHHRPPHGPRWSHRGHRGDHPSRPTPSPVGRRILLTCGYAGLSLALAACGTDSPQVLSEAPVASTSATLDSSGPASTTTSTAAGKFVARCLTEADPGATPGDTVFTDGSHASTDFCLRRFYVGIQPAPGSIFLPDKDAAEQTGATTSPAGSAPTWTPAQPRTDRFDQTVPPGRPPLSTAVPGPAGAESTPAPGVSPVPVPTAVPTVPEQPVSPSPSSAPGQSLVPTPPIEIPGLPTPTSVPTVPTLPTATATAEPGAGADAGADGPPHTVPATVPTPGWPGSWTLPGSGIFGPFGSR